MGPAEVLKRTRSAILIIDQDGTVTDAFGAVDGIAGHDVADLVHRSVFDFIAPEEHVALAEVFLAPEADVPVLDRPMPLPVTLLSADGARKEVDVLPSGFDGPDGKGWVVTITPWDLHSAAYEIVDAVIDGASLRHIARLLAQRNTRVEQGRPLLSTHVLLGFATPSVEVVSALDEPEVARALEAMGGS